MAINKKQTQPKITVKDIKSLAGAVLSQANKERKS